MLVSPKTQTFLYQAPARREFTRPVPKKLRQVNLSNKKSKHDNSDQLNRMAFAWSSAAILKGIQSLLRLNFRPKKPRLSLSYEAAIGRLSTGRAFILGSDTSVTFKALPMGFNLASIYRDGILKRKSVSRRFGPIKFSAVYQPDKNLESPEIRSSFVLQSPFLRLENLPIQSHGALEIPLNLETKDLVFKVRGNVSTPNIPWLPQIRLGIGGEWGWSREKNS